MNFYRNWHFLPCIDLSTLISHSILRQNHQTQSFDKSVLLTVFLRKINARLRIINLSFCNFFCQANFAQLQVGQFSWLSISRLWSCLGLEESFKTTIYNSFASVIFYSYDTSSQQLSHIQIWNPQNLRILQLILGIL